MSLRVGGIKVSHPLAQLDIAQGEEPGGGLATLLDGLCAERINLTFFTRLAPGAPTVASLCVAEIDRARAEEVARSVSGLPLRLTVVVPVVAVSIFPHRADLALLAGILHALHQRDLPILGLATSLSALTFTLGSSHLAQALTGLDSLVELPDNHAPLRWEQLVKQTPI